MSVKRRDLIRYLERSGFLFQREGGNHTLYRNEQGITVAVKRHKIFDRITANEICKDAGLQPIF